MNQKKTVMDALDAPQWTDFTSSPQVSDDFFNRLHLEHESDYHQKLKQCGTSDDKYTRMQLFSTEDDSDFEDVLDEVQVTPIKMISPKNKNNKDDKMLKGKETTFGNLLLEAMSNLQLSTKKGRTNRSFANSSSDTLKTPKMTNKRITRSMSTRINSECSASHVSSKLEINETDVETLGESNSSNIHDNVPEIETSGECDIKKGVEPINFAKMVPSRIVTSFENPTTTFSSNEITDQSEKSNNVPVESSESKAIEPKLVEKQKSVNKDKAPNEIKDMPSRIVTSFGSRKSSGSTKSDSAPNKKRPYLITSIRRQSLIKNKRNDQYVSLAEAVSKFQKGTPKRFRTVSSKKQKLPGPVATSKQVALKITRPISPELTSKTRVRSIKASNNVQKENVELQKIRNRPIRANQVPSSLPASKNSEPIRKVAKKPSTVPEPFHLTQSRKASNFSSTESLSIPQSRQTCHSSITSLHHDTLHLKADQSIQKKVVHTIVSTKDANLAVQEVELGHFGIPTEPCDKPKKFTRTLPFSFEVRNKEFQEKKERKLKQMQSEDMNKKMNQAEFHAKQAPSYSTRPPREPSATRGKMTPKQNSKETSVPKKTTPCPFSFEERNKLIVKKREFLIKEALEKDKKAREFHAKPVPEFRPVIVRGRSRENLRREENTPEKPQRSNIKVAAAVPVAKTCFYKKK